VASDEGCRWSRDGRPQLRNASSVCLHTQPQSGRLLRRGDHGFSAKRGSAPRASIALALPRADREAALAVDAGALGALDSGESALERVVLRQSPRRASARNTGVTPPRGEGRAGRRAHLGSRAGLIEGAQLSPSFGTATETRGKPREYLRTTSCRRTLAPSHRVCAFGGRGHRGRPRRFALALGELGDFQSSAVTSTLDVSRGVQADRPIP
jgi:hypothetical protein